MRRGGEGGETPHRYQDGRIGRAKALRHHKGPRKQAWSAVGKRKAKKRRQERVGGQGNVLTKK